MCVCVCVSYIWLCWEGFSDGLSRFASSISLKPELPTFLANWERKETDIFLLPALLYIQQEIQLENKVRVF